jgi:hypothetical protein
MDQITKFKNALLKAKQKLFKDKSESEEMYGEGVLTRRQAKEEAKNPKVEPINEINNLKLTTSGSIDDSSVQQLPTTGVNFINNLIAKFWLNF